MFVLYIVFVISIFLQVCSTWWVSHSHYTIPLYCQYFPNLKINCQKKYALMLKFHAFSLLMHFMSRFCCRLWASRLTNVFTLMKPQTNSIGTLIHFPRFSFFPNFTFKKSVPLQLNRWRGGLSLNEIKNQIQKIMNFFRSSKAITQGCGSKITFGTKLWDSSFK